MTQQTDHHVDAALCRSAIYEALADGFQRPGSPPSGVLRDGSRRGALVAAARFLDESLGPLAAGVLDAATASPPSALGERYDRIFGHTTRGEVSPFEAEYGEKDIFQQPQELADIGGFYRAFGLEIRPETVVRLDHAACECEFMAFLCRKEAYAAEAGDARMLQDIARGQRLFLADHLARFGLAFGTLLVKCDGGGLYGALGRFMTAFLETECRRHDVRPGSRKLKVGVWKDDGVPAACGGCDVAVGQDAAMPNGSPIQKDAP